MRSILQSVLKTSLTVAGLPEHSPSCYVCYVFACARGLDLDAFDLT